MKNYTSTVSVENTVTRIEKALTRAGASNIAKDYDDGLLNAIRFTILHPEMRKPVTVRLPADVEAVRQVMAAKIKRPRKNTLSKIQNQAERTAWKIIQDWVEIQISLIEMKQADFLQVFLPYIWNGKTTFYGQLRESQFKLLTPGGDHS